MTTNRTDWSRIQAEYLAGGVSLRELSERHAVPLDTLEKRCQKGRWTEQRRQVGEKVAAELPVAVADIVTKDLAAYLAESLQVLDLALRVAVDQIKVGTLEFRSLGEALGALARVTKTQAELASMAMTARGEAADLEAALDDLDQEAPDYSQMDPAELSRLYREEAKRSAS